MMAFFVFLLTIITAAIVFAQGDVSELQYTIIQNTGTNGFQLPEVALPDSTLNPASLTNMSQLGAKGFVSTLYGNTILSNGSIDMTFYSAGHRFKKWCFNLNIYDSTSSRIGFLDTSPLAGTETSFRINATELCVAYSLDEKLSLGAAFIANQHCEMSLHTTDSHIGLANGTSESTNNFRLGLQYKPDSRWTLGAVYSTRTDNINMTLYPEFSGLENPFSYNSAYTTNMFTAGAAYKLSESTTLFYNHQFTNVRGPSTFERNFAYFGIQQQINKNFNIKLVSNDGTPEYHLNYFNQGFFTGLYYNEGGKDVEYLVGKPRKIFFWIGTYF